MPKYYTGVGSRETPEDVLELMQYLGMVLARDGYILRSGAAPGADSAFQLGVKEVTGYTRTSQEIYLPWNGFEGHEHNPDMGFYVASMFSNWEEAGPIALEARGSWNGLGQGGIKLQTRNVYQVLGQDLKTPSRFLICYAKPIGKNGKVSGGTNTAVQIALKHGVQVRNLYDPSEFNRSLEFLDFRRIRHNLKPKMIE